MHWCLIVQCQAILSRLDDTTNDFQNFLTSHPDRASLRQTAVQYGLSQNTKLFKMCFNLIDLVDIVHQVFAT